MQITQPCSAELIVKKNFNLQLLWISLCIVFNFLEKSTTTSSLSKRAKINWQSFWILKTVRVLSVSVLWVQCPFLSRYLQMIHQQFWEYLESLDQYLREVVTFQMIHFSPWFLQWIKKYFNMQWFSGFFKPFNGTLFLTVDTIPYSSSTDVAVLRIKDQSLVIS